MDANNRRGTPIRGTRPGPFPLQYLPPLIEEEQPYEESVASSEEEVSYDMDSFESSEEEGTSYDMDSFESFEEEDEDEEGENYVEIVLYDDPRITARIPRPDSIKAEPLSNRDRTELLFGKTPSSFSGMQYISDIYLIKSGFNFIVPCRVSIQLKTKYNENMNDLKAVVRDNDQWTEIPATLENGYAVFKVKSMDCVYVVTIPKTTEANVTEDGYEFASDVDDRIGISVPKKAVERPTTLLIKVLLPNGVAAGKFQQIRNKCNIVAISPCLCVEYRDSGKLKKPVTMTLPLNLPSKRQDCNVVILTLEEDDVTLVKTTIRVGDRGTVSAKIHSSKNQVCAVVKKTVDVKLLHDEALLKLGIAQQYQVLSFWDSKDRRVFLIQCTPLEKLQEVIDKRNEEGYVLERNGKSEPLVLRQDQRLRIDITGNIEKCVHHPQIAYFITVLFSAHDQSTFFPYNIRRTVGGTYFGILSISSDNFKKRELWSMHFDPDVLIGSQNIRR